MNPCVRFLVFLLVALSLMLEAAPAEPPITREWRQRLSESARRRIIREGEQLAARPVVPATPILAPRVSPPPEEAAPILSSLTGLLTQAATETLTFSREIRPSLDWSGAFRRAQESEGWSWRRRLESFRNRAAESAVILPSATDSPAAPTPVGEDP